MSPADCASYYSCQFSAMISDWRVKFQNPSLPFLFVELPPYVENLYSVNVNNQTDEALPLLRQAQAQVAQVGAHAGENTHKVSIIDHGDMTSKYVR